MTRGLKALVFFRLCQSLLLLAASCALVIGSPATAIAAVPLMPIEEVQIGAHGTARTVVTGTRIEEFGVEVLGIMKNKGAVGDLILVRTYGDLIDRAGGVAQGMSGSPVFIDGRLIGAIGYGWKLTDQRTAMVTPIHDMLKLLDRKTLKELEPQPVKPALEKPVPEKPAEKAPPAADKSKSRKRKPDAKKEKIPETRKDSDPNKPAGKYQELLSTPLMAAGFGETALTFLQTHLKPLNLTPVTVGDPPSDIAYGELQPGSAIGVQLVRGDVSLGALGTVTYVDGDKVLAFGHPFLKRGPTAFMMTNAYIFTTIRGIESSFKVGVTGDVIGTVDQDRGAGVAGEMNRFPGIVPMRMSIRSSELAETRSMDVQMVQDEAIVPILATAALLNSVDKSIDRAGSGTARISFEISARNMPGEIYKRENMFYSPENISEATLAEFFEFMAFLASNPHNPVTIMDIKTDIEVGRERRTARILSARPLQISAKPGDTINVEVKLKPFRQEPITRNVSFTVPKEQAAGSLSLSVRGGGFVSLAALLKKLGAEGELPKPTRKPPKSFEEMIKEFSTRDRNNDIVVELPGFGDLLDDGAGGEKKPKLKLVGSEKSAVEQEPAKPEKPGKTKPAASLLSARKPEAKVKGVLTTDFIIEGETEVSIEISKTESR